MVGLRKKKKKNNEESDADLPPNDSSDTFNDDDHDGDNDDESDVSQAKNATNNNNHDHSKRREVTERVKSSIWFGLIEAVLMLFEYLLVFVVTYRVVTAFFIATTTSSSARHSISSANSNITTTTNTSDTSSTIESDVLEATYGLNLVIAHSLTLLWIYYRNRSISNGIDFLPSRFGISWSGWKMTGTSKTTLLLILLHASAALLVQHFIGFEILSMKTHIRDDGHWNIRATLSLVVLPPLSEEFLWRGIMFYVFYNRGRRLVASILGTNLLFGIAHLSNLLSSSTTSSLLLSAPYVFAQTILGIEIGVFYSIRFVLSRSLWESILLHFANNLFSSFFTTLPTLADPVYLFTLIETVAMYSYLLKISFNELEDAILSRSHHHRN
eukprot:TRINITY_DN4262_c0_g1_i1.p1 TRINITY_DN4262_c0_g1~~TRINITY_DN4262_c0_g1_i1.p1  ORF type:complete len:384 (-),score=96.27 TRINITY_DN4262_c0_g1_i1:99-1250(-)